MGNGSEIILMSHGGGGTRTGELLRDVILPEIGNDILLKLDDAACVPSPGEELVITTDSYVIRPLVFPGGDIGKLAVCGTVNDLAMQGAESRYLTLGLILEEGLEIDLLKKVMQSAGEAAREAGVLVVAYRCRVDRQSITMDPHPLPHRF